MHKSGIEQWLTGPPPMNQLGERGISPVRESAIIAAIGAGTFVFALQVAELLVALPSMTSFLRPPLSTDWAVTTYLLSLCSLLVLFGRVGDVFGTKRIYVAGLLVFTGASLLCAMAKSPWPFLLARAAQGVGSALSAANSPAILSRNLFPERRGRALGWQASMTYLGLTVGPTIGAYAVAHFAWRAIFLLDIPVGGLAIGLGVWAIPRDVFEATANVGIRISETFIWLVCLVSLLGALSGSAEWGWRSAKTGGLLFVSLVAFATFVVTERRYARPLVDLTLFRTRGFSIAVAGELLFYLALYGLGFLVPILIVRGRGMAPGWAGMLLTIQSIIRTLIAPVSGIASDRFGTRAVLSTGTIFFSVGILIIACTSKFGSIMVLAIAIAFVGLGTGVFVPANSSRLLSSAPLQHHGMASGVLATARNLGMMLGVAMAAAAYSGSLVTSGEETVLFGVRRGLSFVLLASAAVLFASWIPDAAHPLTD